MDVPKPKTCQPKSSIYYIPLSRCSDDRTSERTLKTQFLALMHLETRFQISVVLFLWKLFSHSQVNSRNPSKKYLNSKNEHFLDNTFQVSFVGVPKTECILAIWSRSFIPICFWYNQSNRRSYLEIEALHLAIQQKQLQMTKYPPSDRNFSTRRFALEIYTI